MKVKPSCKIATSGRCVKAETLNDPACLYNETTKRCNKVKKKISVKPKELPRQQQHSVHELNFNLKTNATVIGFTNIPQKFYLKNVSNSTDDLNIILQHLKLPKMKSKTEKCIQIRKYISNVLQKFPLQKVSMDTFELNITPDIKAKYQFKNCKNVTVYDITLFLLYFAINDYVASGKKKHICSLIDSKLPMDMKEIQKSVIQKVSKKSELAALSIREMNRILALLEITETSASKSEKCSILSNLYKLYKEKNAKCYIVLDEQHALFRTKPRRILYNIYHNILVHRHSELFQIILLLQKNGLLPQNIYDIPLVKGCTYNKLVKNAIVTRQNFPDYPFREQLQTIPKTPSTTPSSPPEYYLSHRRFLKLSKDMDSCISVFQKRFVSGKYKLIDLVPPRNRLENVRDIRMYHGTKHLHWDDIKKNGLKPVGGGTLGKGFYFTPSVKRATNYLFREKREQKHDLDPVLLELRIKDADTLKVGNLSSDYPIKTLPIFNDGYYWQFVVSSPEIIQKYFTISRVFKLDI